MVDPSVINSIKNYMAQLGTFGIHPEKTVLFGSFATGRADEFSDIDLIVIAQEFDDSVAREKMVKLAVKEDTTVETVNDSFILNRYSGVGCMLRYLRPDQYRI